MAAYLDLDHITADPALVERVPYGLATYYLALPLALEAGKVSVAMAHPDNAAALAVLEGLLQAHVVPVRGSADAIRAALNRLHPLPKSWEPRILAWNSSPDWAAAVASLATAFSAVLATPVTRLDASQVELDTVLTLAREGRYSLTILHPPESQRLAHLLDRSATPLALVRGDHDCLKRILIVMRGFASDDRALDWVAPFVWQNAAAVTLLPLTEPPIRSLHDMLSTNGPAKQHIERCLHRFEADGVQAYLKFRQGPPVAQVVDEVAQDAYDLLVIAAEAHGDFVTHVMAEIERRRLHARRPVLIIKPLTPL